MATLPALAFASALATATLNPAVGDYPPDALRRKASVAGVIDAMIDAEGKATACTFRPLEGDASMGETLCTAVLKLRHTPARDAEGNTTTGELMLLARLFIPETPDGEKVAGARQPADAELALRHIAGDTSGTNVKILVSVDERGAVTRCAPERRERQKKLADAVCKDAERLAPRQRKGADGTPLAYVTQLLVRVVGG